MPNAVSKIPLSGSTKGKGILIVATSTPGTTVHVTGNSGSTVIDEAWIYLVNPYTANILATIEFGGVTSPGNVITVDVPYKQGLYLCVPGLPLVDGAAGALTVSIFGATASQLTAFGYVQRITP